MFTIWARCDYSAPVPGSGRGNGTEWDLKNRKLLKVFKAEGTAWAKTQIEPKQQELEGPVVRGWQRGRKGSDRTLFTTILQHFIPRVQWRVLSRRVKLSLKSALQAPILTPSCFLTRTYHASLSTVYLHPHGFPPLPAKHHPNATARVVGRQKGRSPLTVTKSLARASQQGDIFESACVFSIQPHVMSSWQTPKPNNLM